MPADLATDAPSPTADADAKPLFASFRKFLHGLPPEQREALLLTEYEGLTQKALADRLGVAVSTVKSRVQRGRKRLEQALLDCCAFEHIRIVRGDCRDERIMRDLVKDADVVIPLAALVGAPRCDIDPIAARSTNFDAIRLLCQTLS